MNDSPVEVTETMPHEAKSTATRNLIAETRMLIRKNPAGALAIAVGAGFVLQSAPVGRLAGGLLRLGFALLKPALMVAGGVKLWEKYQRRQIL